MRVEQQRPLRRLGEIPVERPVNPINALNVDELLETINRSVDDQLAGVATALPESNVAALQAAYPKLNGLRRTDGGLARQYLLSLDGTRFLADPHERLEPGSRLLLLSADAGG